VSQASFRKRQREKAQRERAAAKFAKRTERAAEVPPEPSPPMREQQAVLADLAELHERFKDGKVTFDDFEDKKQQLTDELDVR
jgi:hypothetical protein